MRTRINVPAVETCTCGSARCKQPTVANIEHASMKGAPETDSHVGIVVHGWQPGNGSRYDLSFARRAGGGWIVVWDSAWITCKVYARGAGLAAIEVVAAPPDVELSQPDRAALRVLCTALADAGVLS